MYNTVDFAEYFKALYKVEPYCSLLSILRHNVECLLMTIITATGRRFSSCIQRAPVGTSSFTSENPFMQTVL